MLGCHKLNATSVEQNMLVVLIYANTKKDGLHFNFQEHYLSVSLPQTFLLTGTDDNTY